MNISRRIIKTGILPALTVALILFAGVCPAQNAVSDIKSQPLIFKAGPYVRHIRPGSAVIEWEATILGAAKVEFGLQDSKTSSVQSKSNGRRHEVELPDLLPAHTYHYLIAMQGKSGEEYRSASFAFDTTEVVPYPETGPSPYATDDPAKVYENAVELILSRCGIRKGYCLVVGGREGRLAYEIARRSDLTIVCVEDDLAKVTEARTALSKAGIYGSRVSVEHADLSQLPYTNYFANLIVSDSMLLDGKFPSTGREAYRLLAPGGAIILGSPKKKVSDSALAVWLERAKNAQAVKMPDEGSWIMIRRGPLPGAGQWTHMYATPANTACSGDARIGNPTRVQWFGLPGPRLMIDRHHRTVSPLAAHGRMFIPADNRIIAVDAYNGTRLWDLDIPGTRRLAAPREAGSMALSDSYLYVATEDRCVCVDAQTGRPSATFTMPQLVENQTRHWGYTAIAGSMLFGSGRKQGAVYSSIGKAADYEIQWGDFKGMVTSDSLFALDRHTGETLWTYKSGVIITPAIAIGDGRLFFAESASPKAAESADGLVNLPTLAEGDGISIVCLDAATGQVLWREKPDLRDCQHCLYFSYADGILLVQGSSNREGKAWYFLYGFDATSGALLWRADHPNNKGGIGGDHGEQVHHPVIAGNFIFAEPCAYELKTGKRVDPTGGGRDWVMPARGGCGTISASASCIFFRDGNPTMYDTRNGGIMSRLSSVSRPGCWINIVPAGGLALVPEASSGCTCGYSIQASFAFAPAGDDGLD
ncbi:MAG TPA: PQQ-binding-like beta-propeller repeat protein [Candidatus Brocadiia bacterium]|nr:PQQ-binding-like beta-propeller repeat protein [Candidatus Brocadiia bacterium]